MPGEATLEPATNTGKGAPVKAILTRVSQKKKAHSLCSALLEGPAMKLANRRRSVSECLHHKGSRDSEVWGQNHQLSD